MHSLIDKIKQNKVAIYGTGYVAMRFYHFLVDNKITDNLMYFITTKGNEKVDQYDVLSINDPEISKDLLILVAVHESIKNEIIESLETRDFHNYIWIYPQLYEIMLGQPVKKNEMVALRDIWLANRNNYWMAVRYLAIDNYFHKNTYGYEIYKMAMSLYNSRQTSEKRLEKFIQLIQNWEENGYNSRYPVLIFDDYNCIDGAHRMALASYFERKNIICNVFSSDCNKNIIHNPKAMFPKSLIGELDIDIEILRVLEATNRRIDKQYGIVN